MRSLLEPACWLAGSCWRRLPTACLLPALRESGSCRREAGSAGHCWSPRCSGLLLGKVSPPTSHDPHPSLFHRCGSTSNGDIAKAEITGLSPPSSSSWRPDEGCAVSWRCLPPRGDSTLPRSRVRERGADGTQPYLQCTVGDRVSFCGGEPISHLRGRLACVTVLGRVLSRERSTYMLCLCLCDTETTQPVRPGPTYLSTVASFHCVDVGYPSEFVALRGNESVHGVHPSHPDDFA
jgi:hypothetical protein